MNFKKEYQDSFSNIKAEEEFKKSLVEQMNQESVPIGKKAPYIGILATAATALLLVGAGFAGGILFSGDTAGKEGNLVAEHQGTSDTVEEDISIELEGDILAGPGESGDMTELDIPGDSWYGEITDATERLELFVSLMDGKELEAVHLASRDESVESTKLRKKEVDAMVEQFRDAECADIDASKVMSGEFDMYQMRLKDGRKIHFLISEEGYLLLMDTGDVFRLENP